MRLILHAGTHKTGTTSVQKVLADNRGWLRERGLHYPDGHAAFGITKVPHHKFAHALVGDDGEALEKARRFIEEDCRTIESDRAVMVSAEPVWRHIDGRRDYYCYTLPDYWERRARYLSRLAQHLTNFDVTVLIVLREVQSFAQSLHAEMINNKRWRGAKDDFLAEFAPWFEYDRQIALFRSFFRDVRTESYEKAKVVGLVPWFFQQIEFPCPPNSAEVWERKTEDAHLSDAHS